MLVSGETDLDVPEVVHHVDSENPNTHDADDDFEEKVTFFTQPDKQSFSAMFVL